MSKTNAWIYFKYAKKGKNNTIIKKTLFSQKKNGAVIHKAAKDKKQKMNYEKSGQKIFSKNLKTKHCPWNGNFLKQKQR